MRLVILCILSLYVLGSTPDYTDQANWTGECTTGTSQSPIDIVTSTDQVMDEKLKLKFNDLGSIEANPSLTDEVKMTGDGGKTKLVDTDGSSSEWSVAQYHWHAPSEHTVNGDQFDAELHIVHTNEAGDAFLVVGILFDTIGAYNVGSEAFMEDFMWTTVTTSDTIDSRIDQLLRYMPDKSFYHYEGSLTTPPCTEAVSWFVMREAQRITVEDLAAMEAFFPASGTDRDIQD